MYILEIVPARRGSKGIPRRNFADVCGRPLIARSIATGTELLATGALTRRIVSTDDEGKAAVARSFGADVLFLRSPEKATCAAKVLAYGPKRSVQSPQREWLATGWRSIVDDLRNSGR